MLVEAFTFLEVMVVVTIVAILAAVVMPRFDGLTADARSSAALSAVAGVRSSIAAYRTRMVISGEDPFPTLEALITPGEVLQTELPPNPYNGLSGVRLVTAREAGSRVVVGGPHGWCYYVDNDAERPHAIIYLNSNDQTRVSSGDGGFKTANQL